MGTASMEVSATPGSSPQASAREEVLARRVEELEQINEALLAWRQAIVALRRLRDEPSMSYDARRDWAERFVLSAQEADEPALLEFVWGNLERDLPAAALQAILSSWVDFAIPLPGRLLEVVAALVAHPDEPLALSAGGVLWFCLAGGRAKLSQAVSGLGERRQRLFARMIAQWEADLRRGGAPDAV